MAHVGMRTNLEQKWVAAPICAATPFSIQHSEFRVQSSEFQKWYFTPSMIFLEPLVTVFRIRPNVVDVVVSVGNPKTG